MLLHPQVVVEVVVTQTMVFQQQVVQAVEVEEALAVELVGHQAQQTKDTAVE